MNLSKTTAAAGLLLALAPNSLAQLTSYSQNFDALDMADPAALAAEGFNAYANVFDPMGGFIGGYGFPAPNGGQGFSAIGAGLGGAAQGPQYIDVYSDYSNIEHGNGNYIDALVYREQGVNAANVGQTWRMSFDFLRNPNVNNGQGDTTMFAFVKVLMSSNGSFATIAEVELDTTAASTAMWDTMSLDLVIDPAFAGELLQYGFRSYATNYNDSSVLYDNLTFEQQGGSPPSLTPYSQDFEGLDIADPAALTVDGYKIFANVFDPAGNRLYGYGVFDAPNGGPGFSAIGAGSGGVAQGAQYLNIYSDYNNADHGNGNYIEALVFQEQPISTADVGKTATLTFDYLRNPTVINGEGDSTMFAFIKVLQSSNGSFGELVVRDFETTGASDTLWQTATITIPIDATLDGELLQFGFRSYATNFNDTGRFYDNISFDVAENDDCAGAMAIGEGVTLYDNTFATDSLVDMPCVFNGESNDLWFSYTAGANCPVTVDLSGSDYDTGLAIWEGDCSNLVLVDCNDDGGTGLDSLISFNAMAGTTYLLQVGGFSTSTGTGIITLTEGLGMVICAGEANSSGNGADLKICGSTSVAANNLVLEVTGLPANAMGYFVTSLDTIFVANPGGSQGNLCIASAVMGRYAQNVLDSGAGGAVSFSADLTAIPTPSGPVPAIAGETRFFQYWTRDNVMGAPTSNFSSAVGVTFE